MCASAQSNVFALLGHGVYSPRMIRFQLQKLLNDCGWTVYQLSKESGIHPSVLSKYRHNQVKAVSLETLDAMCKALRCQPGDLIEYVAESKESQPGLAAS